MSHKVNKLLQESLKQSGMDQKELARRLYKGNSTVNGYVTGRENVPVNTMEDISRALNDDLLTQDFAHIVFQQLPPMKSDVFNDCLHTYDIIQIEESRQRKGFKEQAMLALIKRKETLTDEDIESIRQYADNFLDEVFVEIRYVTTLFNHIDTSMTAAINQRKRHWKRLNYMK